MKKLNKKQKNIIILLFIVAITCFGGSNAYIRDWVSKLEKKVVEQTLGGTIPENTSNKLIGKITHISDGDTVTLKDNNGKKHKVRLNGIDCPEMGQEYGDEAREFVNNLSLNKYVEVEIISTDQYNRILGVIHVDNTNINEELLSNGLAWVYRFNDNVRYKSLMQQAKSKKINIWSNSNSIDPYVWRKKNKQNN